MRFEMSRNNGPKLLNDEALATHMHIVFVFILLCEDPFKYANLCKDICFFVHLLHIGLLYHSAYEQKVLDGIAQHCFPALGTQRPAPNAQHPSPRPSSAPEIACKPNSNRNPSSSSAKTLQNECNSDSGHVGSPHRTV